MKTFSLEDWAKIDVAGKLSYLGFQAQDNKVVVYEKDKDEDAFKQLKERVDARTQKQKEQRAKAVKAPASLEASPVAEKEFDIELSQEEQENVQKLVKEMEGDGDTAGKVLKVADLQVVVRYLLAKATK